VIEQEYIVKKVHQQILEQGQLDLMQGPPDEIRVKGCQIIAWMGLAIMVSMRLWLAGVVQSSRDRSLADRLMTQVRRCAASLLPLLVLRDGWSAYPGSICRAFREKVKRTAGVGRACLEVWPQLHIGPVIRANKKETGHRDHPEDGSVRLQSSESSPTKGGFMLNHRLYSTLNS
jgi:hypothetical protein